MARLLVTGAGGFVGRTLCSIAARSEFIVRGAYRKLEVGENSTAESVASGDIDANTDWRAALHGIELVVHTAARVHVIRDSVENRRLYMETNVAGTLRLAKMAAVSGVRRFVYLSSIKVNGEETVDRRFHASDRPNPRDAYGESKLAAEVGLLEIGAQTGMEIAIVRPPLVYGEGVSANFLRLMRWVEKGVPIPLGGVRNLRSLVSVWNLCDLLVTVLSHPAAPGRVWMVSDGEDLSTPELIRRIGRQMNRPVRLIAVPPGILQVLATIANKRGEVQRLCGSLAVDIAQTRRDLQWIPPVSVAESLGRTVAWYLRAGHRS